MTINVPSLRQGNCTLGIFAARDRPGLQQQLNAIGAGPLTPQRDAGEVPWPA